MSKLKNCIEEFNDYASVIGLDEIDKNSAQYIETKRAFLSGMLCSVKKLLIDIKEIETEDIPSEIDNLVKDLTENL